MESKIIVGLLLAAFVTGGSSEAILKANFTSTRISGGHNIPIADAKYQVALFLPAGVNEYALACSGSLLKPDIVLTGALCTIDANNKPITNHRACAGDANILTLLNGECSEAKSVIKHSSFDFSEANGPKNDIAIIKLKNSLRLSSTISTIELSTLALPAGINCSVTGWGAIVWQSPLISQYLQRAHVSIYDKDRCTNDFNGLFKLDKSLICTAPSNVSLAASCHADEGAPLVCNGKLIGLSSLGLCGQKPAIYTELRQFSKWIEDNGSHRLSTSLLLTIILPIITMAWRSNI